MSGFHPAISAGGGGVIGFVDLNNSTSTPLANGAVFTGTPTKVDGYPSIVFSLRTDTNCLLEVQFSTDALNWDSTVPYNVTANLNEVHRLTVSKEYYRIRITNNSGVNQTFLRAQVIVGAGPQLSSPINGIIQSDADSLIVRTLDYNTILAEGLYQNRSVVIKDGFNPEVNTATVPEDINNQGGVYAGFPLGAPEPGQIVVAGADTGTVYYSYLAAPTDETYTFASFNIAGAGTYLLPHNIWRCNFAYFLSNNPTTTNVGNITIRNSVTIANVFCVIPATYGQSFCSAFTVPANNFALIDRITGSVRGSQTGAMDGFFWYRDNVATGFRLRFPFELQYGGLYFDDIDYLIRIPPGVDIQPRITVSSANNLVPKISYRVSLVRNT